MPSRALTPVCAAGPADLWDGLAIYDRGVGEPVLLMPAPHGFTLTPAAETPLAQTLLGMGRRIITFDPPGAYRSTRRPDVDMQEMLGCALEAIAARNIDGPLTVAGHSMAGLCALGFAVEHPEQVRRLVLVGAVASGKSALLHRGMPLNRWPIERDFWRFVLPSLRLRSGRGTLADHKRVLRLLYRESYVDRSRAPKVVIAPRDECLPAPVRDRWPSAALRINYKPFLEWVHTPTLVCVGRHDPQAPVACSRELAKGIPGARLVIFEHSGHYPFVEEPDLFADTVGEFLGG
jgi:pimeloyl-ACP methyl ester carboxylesterase